MRVIKESRVKIMITPHPKTYHLTPVTYVNAGINGSLGKMTGGEISNNNVFTGIQLDLFTGFRKVKFGLQTQMGQSFLSYSSEKKSNFFLFSVSPAIQVYF